MKERVFPLVSLGSAGDETPDAADVAAWISGKKGNTADIITYTLDKTLKVQKLYTAEPAAGGAFYAPRIKDFLGAEENVTQEFGNFADSIHEDLRAVKIKNCGFALPAFSALNIADAYYKDAEEFEAAGAESYKILSRELRDAGALKTILHTESPNDLELELLRGKKYLWAVPESALEQVLETARDIVVDAKAVFRLEELLDCYQIRNVYIRDADAESVNFALKYFDREYLFTAGYGDGEEYWKNLAELKIRTEE